ncbi:hypothetical protein [Coriobacterium glomerans]|nr:hypothetical protein [Coriobacterium glomerans]
MKAPKDGCRFEIVDIFEGERAIVKRIDCKREQGKYVYYFVYSSIRLGDGYKVTEG